MTALRPMIHNRLPRSASARVPAPTARSLPNERSARAILGTASRRTPPASLGQSNPHKQTARAKPAPASPLEAPARPSRAPSTPGTHNGNGASHRRVA